MSKLHINPVLRATGVIGSVAALVTGVTFAALSSTATLTNNTISSASADLLISSDPSCSNGTAGFGASAPGFAFDAVVPGGEPTEANQFCLKNDGTSPLYIAAHIPELPVWTVEPDGTVDNSKVKLHVDCGDGSFTLMKDFTTLSGASGTYFEGATLAGGQTKVCDIAVSMHGDAFDGSSATLTEFDVNFVGSSSMPEEEPSAPVED